MNKGITMEKIFRLALMAFIGFSQAQEINIIGRVLDNNSTPISGASVSLATAGLASSTDMNGLFSITGTTNIGNPSSFSHQIYSLENNMVILNLNQPMNTLIEVYNSLGKEIFSIHNSPLKEGVHRFEIAEKLKGEPSGIFHIRTKIGDYAQMAMFYFENGGLLTSKIRNLSKKQSMGKKGVDVLIVSMTGYTTSQVNLDSYQQNMGDIILVPESGGTAGCGTTPPSCDNSDCSVQANGKERTFYVDLPDNYDNSQPHPVVFNYHPLGGSASMARTMYRVGNYFPDAIYISPEGLPSLGGNNLGWANQGGEDEEFSREMFAFLKENYCVDESRIFSTGFSYGGSMSFTAACNLSDIFRAVGAMAGAPISGASCTRTTPERRVAVWATHGIADSVLQISMAEPMMEVLRINNGCSAETSPVEPSPCVAYQGCDPGYPVVWCPREGDGHSIPGFSAEAIANFFKQF